LVQRWDEAFGIELTSRKAIAFLALRKGEEALFCTAMGNGLRRNAKKTGDLLSGEETARLPD
jgi:hypothetical protein